MTLDHSYIFICPYFSSTHSAAKTYMLNIASTLYKACRRILILHPGVSLSNQYRNRSFSYYWFYKYLGSRLTAILLVIYYAFRFRKKHIITDVNPCLAFFIPNVYHVVHHIDDLPSLKITRSCDINDNSSFLNLCSRSSSNFLSFILWRLSITLSSKNMITVSDTVKAQLLSIAPWKNISVLRNYNPLEDFSFRYLTSQSLACFPNFEFDVIMIGQNIPRKNYEFALNVLSLTSKLLDRHLRICLVGSMINKLEVVSFASQLLISTYQNISDESLAQKIVSSKVYMNSSIVEGFCIPYVECQSFGLACLVPDQSIFRENQFTSNVQFSLLDEISFSNALALMLNSDLPNSPSKRVEYMICERRYQLLNSSIQKSILDL